MKIRTCFFDMGNVLVYFSHQLMVRNIAGVSGLSDSDVERFLFQDQWQWFMERGQRTEAEFCDELSSRAGKILEPTAVCHAAANIFQLNSDIIPVLRQLKTAGIRLVLLSNTSLTHIRFIEQNFDVLDFMDERVTSFEVGAMKPDLSIFQAALAKALCPPEECFYTDDIEAYTHTAQSLGIQTHTFTSTDRLKAALETNGVPG